MMKIGILGSGDVGQALGRGFIGSGHAVKIGTRSGAKDRLSGWLDKVGTKGSVGTFAQAAEYGELDALATHGVAMEEVVKAAGPGNFEGKILIDVTNPLLFTGPTSPHLAYGFTDSAGERLQRLLPRARVVKSFNIVGNPLFYQPKLPGGPPDMIICGNDAHAKETVAKVLQEFGWPPPVDIGGIEGSRELESLCILWVKSALALGNWNIAFKLLREPNP